MSRLRDLIWPTAQRPVSYTHLDVYKRQAAATGLAQINRAHIIAGLYRLGDRPLVVICQDDLAAKRLQSELKAFLGQEPPVLPGRDLNLYDAAVVSRVWEQRRLRQLYDLGKGETRLQILSWEAMSLRTIAKGALFSAARCV